MGDPGRGPNGEEGTWDYFSFYGPGDPIQGEIDFESFGGLFIRLTTADATVALVPDAGSTAFMLAFGLGGLIAVRRWLFSASRACVP